MNSLKTETGNKSNVYVEVQKGILCTPSVCLYMEQLRL